MASLTDRVTRLLRSPQAKQLAERAKQLAHDPRTRTRTKIEDLGARLTKRR
ncbi:MAG: hypothetical protein ACRDRN_06260 [Sciscionella sp.]